MYGGTYVLIEIALAAIVIVAIVSASAADEPKKTPSAVAHLESSPLLLRTCPGRFMGRQLSLS